MKNIADAVGIMVYTGTESLRYVKNFVEGAEQWERFPIKVLSHLKKMPALEEYLDDRMRH